MSRTITTSGTTAVLVLIFLLVGAPAWAYLLPAGIACAEIGMQVRARRIDRRR